MIFFEEGSQKKRATRGQGRGSTLRSEFFGKPKKKIIRGVRERWVGAVAARLRPRATCGQRSARKDAHGRRRSGHGGGLVTATIGSRRQPAEVDAAELQATRAAHAPTQRASRQKRGGGAAPDDRSPVAPTALAGRERSERGAREGAGAPRAHKRGAGAPARRTPRKSALRPKGAM